MSDDKKLRPYGITILDGLEDATPAEKGRLAFIMDIVGRCAAMTERNPEATADLLIDALTCVVTDHSQGDWIALDHNLRQFAQALSERCADRLNAQLGLPPGPSEYDNEPPTETKH